MTKSSAYLTSTPRKPLAFTHVRSRTCRATLASNGEIGDPWGVPDTVSVTTPSTSTPALSHARRSFSMSRSDTRSGDQPDQGVVVDASEAVRQVGVKHPLGTPVGLRPDRLQRIVRRTVRPEAEAHREELR